MSYKALEISTHRHRCHIDHREVRQTTERSNQLVRGQANHRGQINHRKVRQTTKRLKQPQRGQTDLPCTSLVYIHHTDTHFSAALSLSAPWVTTPMLQSTQRANPSLSSSSAMLPFYNNKNMQSVSIKIYIILI